MTADAVIRLTRAHEALRAAELLQAEGFHADSVNRAHLSLELAARAALSLHGVTLRTPSAEATRIHGPDGHHACRAPLI